MADKNNLREEFKYIEINGEDYRIGNFNPMVGLYIGSKLLSVFSPLINSFISKNRAAIEQGNDDLDELDFSGIDLQGALKNLNRDEFIEIQTECLKIVEKNTKSGWVKALNVNGSFAYNLTIKETLKLVIECIKFNLSDFFTGESLELTE